MRLPSAWLLSCLLCVVAWLPLHAAQVEITPEPPMGPEVSIDTGAKPKAPPDTGQVVITFTSDAPGNLFQTGQPVVLVMRLKNPGPAEKVSLTTRISTGAGCPVYTDMTGVKLPAQGEITLPVTFDESKRLLQGPFRVDVWVEGEKAVGYGSTLFSVWAGPATSTNPAFGVSYQGPLTGDRAKADLDLFKQAGIGWLRFPLKGWLPQGAAAPPEADTYKQFIAEAGQRGYALVAAFTPTTTVDPAVNSEQANKEYRDSLLAAAAHFGPQVPYWELLRVRPDAQFPELRGFRSPELAKGREALRAFNKNLNAVFSIEDPFTSNIMDLTICGLPTKGDTLGMRYNFVGLPETRDANPRSPLVDLPTVRASAQVQLKRTPPVWVTEYGFDPSKGERLPSATYQAALLARAFVLNRASGVERTFWRHDPASLFDLPLTAADGAAEPSFLALRTTLAALDGATLVSEVSAPEGMHALLFGKGDLSAKGQKKKAGQYLLVLWAERLPSAATIHTANPQVNITDLWGNTVVFDTVDSSVLTTIDEYPRFVTLGTQRDVELINPYAHFKPSRVVLQPGGDNNFGLHILNDPRVFTSNHVFEVSIRRWPGNEPTKMVKTPFNYQYDRYDNVFPLSIPSGARKGQLYDITVEIIVGTRRCGLLTLPVWYNPEPVATSPLK